MFRTPSLRDLELTGPYMHAGHFDTLSEVIDFYKAGGSAATGTGELESFELSDDERSDLLAFFHTLNGHFINHELLEDTAAN